MSLTGRTVKALLMAAVVMSAAACTSGGNASGGTASCVYQVTCKGRTYRDVANVEFTVGSRVGTATEPPCDDTGGRGKDQELETTKTAYAVNGIFPEVAIAVGDTPDDAMFVAVYSGKELPPEVRKLIDAS